MYPSIRNALMAAAVAIFGAVTAAGIHGAWLGAAAVGLTILMVRRPLWGAFAVVMLFLALFLTPLLLPGRAGCMALAVHEQSPADRLGASSIPRCPWESATGVPGRRQRTTGP